MTKADIFPLAIGTLNFGGRRIPVSLIRPESRYYAEIVVGPRQVRRIGIPIDEDVDVADSRAVLAFVDGYLRRDGKASA